jgi:NTE family protein
MLSCSVMSFCKRLSLAVPLVIGLIPLFFLCGISRAQGAVEIPADARVGLVLSGGGARGLAHVGVIRVLESQGIRPAVITGTSMGSVIGALYASGRMADEIERIARGMDWRQALSDASRAAISPIRSGNWKRG